MSDGRNVSLGLATFLAIVLLSSIRASLAEERRNPSAALVCGPRCIQFVMRTYGIEEELTNLVHESQWPNLVAGASLESLAGVLERRGIHALCAEVEFPERMQLDSPYPVVLHLRPKMAQSELGHFVVWLPGNGNGGERIWDPDTGRIEAHVSRGFYSHLSGAILLTSPQVITSPDFAFRPTRAWGVSWSLIAAAILVSVVLLWHRSRRQRA